MTFRSSQSRPRNGPLWTSPLADACEPPSNQAANASPIPVAPRDRKSTRLNSSHANISYAVFCLKKKNQTFNLNQNHENDNGRKQQDKKITRNQPFPCRSPQCSKPMPIDRTNYHYSHDNGTDVIR